MTDRIKGCWVAFERDIRDDDAQYLIDAIRMLRGVQDVTANLANPDDWMNRERVRHEMRQRLISALDDKGKP